MPPYIPNAEPEPRWITRTKLISLVERGNPVGVISDECWRQIAHEIADGKLGLRWADERPPPVAAIGHPTAWPSDAPSRALEYWLNAEINPDNPDQVREPPLYDPALVNKRMAARLDRARRYRTPLFDRIAAEGLWLHRRTSRLPEPIKPIRGSGPRASVQQPADWDKWADMLTAELWQAVALSLDIEPETLSSLDLRANRVGGPFDDCPADFKRRLDVACDHAEHGALRCDSLAPGVPHSTMDLRVFADWALLRIWELPDQFPRNRVPISALPTTAPPVALRTARGQPGPKPEVRAAIAGKMLADLHGGRCTPERLLKDTLATLVTTYGGSPNTANAARKDALAKFSELNQGKSEY